MNRIRSCRQLALALVLAWCGVALAAYNVRRPSDEIRPRWRGARVGEWTMDYDAAAAQAKANKRKRRR